MKGVNRRLNIAFIRMYICMYQLYNNLLLYNQRRMKKRSQIIVFEVVIIPIIMITIYYTTIILITIITMTIFIIAINKKDTYIQNIYIYLVVCIDCTAIDIFRDDKSGMKR